MNLDGILPDTSKLRVRVIKCCISSSTSPTPNSTAENIKKKNVRESRLRLLYTRPTSRVSAYKVIQSNSAVSNRCKEVLVLVIRVLKMSKKRANRILISPKNKIKSLNARNSRSIG